MVIILMASSGLAVNCVPNSSSMYALHINVDIDHPNGTTGTNNPEVTLSYAIHTANCWRSDGTIRFSNDNINWSLLEPFTGSKWTLSPGDGTKTVYAEIPGKSTAICPPSGVPSSLFYCDTIELKTAKPNRDLIVVKNGDGSGTVSSSPAGIDCGSICSAGFDPFITVMLVATPTSGSTFAGWSGDTSWSGDCSGTGRCSVNMERFSDRLYPDASMNVTATFNTAVPHVTPPQQYTLTVAKSGTGSGTFTSNPTGINCGSTCSISYFTVDSSTSVTLTAMAASGSTFAGWSGSGCSGTGSCSVTMDASKNVTATFTLTNSTQYSISGTVRDLSNNPIQGATVTVKDASNNAATTATTDSSGNFVANVPSIGNYTVSTAKSRYEMYSFPQVVVLDATHTTATLSVIYMETSELSFTITLSAGWNFISTPLQPQVTAIGTVLRDISPNIRIAWGYDGSNQLWQIYKPSGSKNTLTTIEAGKGYWMYMDNQETLTITGLSSTTTVHLYENWNLIGYKGTDGTSVTIALSSLGDKWKVIWGWDNGQWYVKDPVRETLPVPALSNLYQGKAYWIKIKPGQATDWTQ